MSYIPPTRPYFEGKGCIEFYLKFVFQQTKIAFHSLRVCLVFCFRTFHNRPDVGILLSDIQNLILCCGLSKFIEIRDVRVTFQ